MPGNTRIRPSEQAFHSMAFHALPTLPKRSRSHIVAQTHVRRWRVLREIAWRALEAPCLITSAKIRVARAALCAFHLNIHKKRAGRAAARPARKKHLPEILSRKASPIGERSACLGQCLRQCSPFPPPDCRSIPRVPGYIAPKCRISCRKYRLPRSRGNPFRSRPAT